MNGERKARATPPQPPTTRCENCDTVAAEVVCHICKQPRHAFRALLAPLNAQLKDAA